MNKSTLPVGIRSLVNWRTKGVLRFDMPIQRAEGQWSNLQQSIFIHSVITNFPIPSLYFLKEKEDGETVYSVLDGLQRLSTIFAFIDGQFALHSSTPPVVVEDVDYDLENLYFDDLSEECKDAILGARLSVFCIEDCTNEEIEELFSRLNSSTPLTTIQKARTAIGSELALWAKSINSLPFFNYSVNFSLNQARREASFETLLQSMLLLDARSEGYEYKSISMGDVRKYCEHIRGSYSQEKKQEVEDIIGYLGIAFPEKCKWLKKSNVPTAVVIAKIAMEQEIKPADFKTFIDAFSNMLCPDFEANTGSGNIRRVKTEGRIEAVYNVFLQHFGLDAKDVRSPFYEPEMEEPVEEEIEEGYDEDFSEEESTEKEAVAGDPSENSEVNDDNSSLEEGEQSEPANYSEVSEDENG